MAEEGGAAAAVAEAAEVDVEDAADMASERPRGVVMRKMTMPTITTTTTTITETPTKTTTTITTKTGTKAEAAEEAMVVGASTEEAAEAVDASAVGAALVDEAVVGTTTTTMPAVTPAPVVEPIRIQQRRPPFPKALSSPLPLEVDASAVGAEAEAGAEAEEVASVAEAALPPLLLPRPGQDPAPWTTLSAPSANLFIRALELAVLAEVDTGQLLNMHAM